MKLNRFYAAVVFVIVILSMSRGASGQYWTGFKALYSFTGLADGSLPLTLISDTAGNLYGTTMWGGVGGFGAVFKLAPGSDGTWLETVIHSFKFSEGENPNSLIFDTEGNLYGTCSWGGPHGSGTIFKLTPDPDGSWTYNLLHAFIGEDGIEPVGLTFDPLGNLYGTSIWGGVGAGAVFEMTANPDGTWSESVLHSFTCDSGCVPYAGVVRDSAGNLYGTTNQGGTYDLGVVFKLTPNPDGSWTEDVLHDFTGGKDGKSLFKGVSFDSAGNLVGTASYGGNVACLYYGCGTAFQMKSNGYGGWTFYGLHDFTGGNDGSLPSTNLISDAAGSLYGATDYARHAAGSVFKLTPNPEGTWTLYELHQFTGIDGAYPDSLILNQDGNLYGTASSGGSYGYGTVFEIIPVGGASSKSGTH